jgi:general secretion pathway protein J
MKARRGFTLVEVMVALAILALTMTLAYRATAALADGEQRLSAESARWRSLDVAMARLEADLREAVPRSVRSADRRLPAFTATTDESGNAVVEWSRAGAEFSIEPGIAGQRIGYRLASGRLEVLYWPALDNPGTTTPAAYALAEEVAAFRLDYLAADGQWLPSWPTFGETEIPRAVRARLVLASGEPIERWFALR